MIAAALVAALSLAGDPCLDTLDEFTRARAKRAYASAEGALVNAFPLCTGGDAAGHPTTQWMFEALADVQLMQEKWDAGLASADRCVAVDAGNPCCHFYRWFALRQLGRWKEVDAAKPRAARAFEAYLARKPGASATPRERERLASRQGLVKGYHDIFRRAADRQ